MSALGHSSRKESVRHQRKAAKSTNQAGVNPCHRDKSGEKYGKPSATIQKAGRRKRGAPDMKAWAALAFARLKAHYGDRIVADSAPLLEDMKADRF